jgi:predicted nucleotidyltransferase
MCFGGGWSAETARGRSNGTIIGKKRAESNVRADIAGRKRGPKTIWLRPGVKPLLYVYRVLLTGIHLMRTGEVEANLARLNETAKLPYISGLIAQKVGGAEKGRLEQASLAFYKREYQRLTMELERAHGQSHLPETTHESAAMNDLLVRIRLKG